YGDVRQSLQRIFDLGEEPKGIEEQMLRKDGSVIDVSVSTTIVFDHEARPRFTVTVARDITEKKKMEQKIRQAQKIDSIGGLAGGVAHDFNNILSSILGSASIMRRRMSPKGKWYKYVDMIEAASRRGAALTRQLLTFARRDHVRVRPVDVHSILDETLRLFERSVSKSIAVKKAYAEDLAIMNGDEGQLQQAFLNLFINARDAMPEGGTLTVETNYADLHEGTASLYEQGKSGTYLKVVIGDTGIGMERRVLQRIFEPFFTTKDSGKGTGLGLSVVYGVVHGHGGFIHVESKEGVGTTFVLFLPRLTSEKRIRREPRQQKLRGGAETILLVDDEPPVCEIASDMLMGLGYKVIVAEDGEKALSLYRQQKSMIGLVILDIDMPQMDGHETLQRLHQSEPNVPVLISSGYGCGGLGIDAFNGKIEGFLQKPYQIEDIAKVVREVLDRPKNL
ncbi:MAG: response regulator, partial [Bacteroidota bacterium]